MDVDRLLWLEDSARWEFNDTALVLMLEAMMRSFGVKTTRHLSRLSELRNFLVPLTWFSVPEKGSLGFFSRCREMFGGFEGPVSTVPDG